MPGGSQVDHLTGLPIEPDEEATLEAARGAPRLLWRALWLDTGAYREMAAAPRPVLRGGILVFMIGLILAGVQLVGAGTIYLTTPSPDALHDTLYNGLTAMPWYADAVSADPEFADTFHDEFERQFEQQAVRTYPTLGGVLTGAIFTPFAGLMGWVVFGLAVHLAARWMFRAEARLAPTLGMLAAAQAPRLLGIMEVMPAVSAGTAVGVWSLLTTYWAVKTAYNLRWTRALGVWLTGQAIIVVGTLLLLMCNLLVGVIALTAGGATP
jgi:hypothetical protein